MVKAHRLREEVVRPRVEDFDPATGVADMLDDFHEGQYTKGRTEEETEATAKAFYDMMSSAQKPLHDQTLVSQLDAIGHLMGFQSECSMSRVEVSHTMSMAFWVFYAGPTFLA
jgi:hypothetical protein